MEHEDVIGPAGVLTAVQDTIVREQKSLVKTLTISSTHNSTDISKLMKFCSLLKSRSNFIKGDGTYYLRASVTLAWRVAGRIPKVFSNVRQLL